MKNIHPSNPIIKEKIKKALKDFKKTWKNENAIYEEMCFCILTPQSSAKQAMKSINQLKEHNLLDKGSYEQKEPFVKNVRFFRTKAKRLVLVQEKFPKNEIKNILKNAGLPKDPHKARSFLVSEVNGYGLKEASHFLRNIGFGRDIAILDRHILKNLKNFGVIKEIPKTISKKNYLEIENKMRVFCKKNKVDFSELDLIFWSNETNDVLK